MSNRNWLLHPAVGAGLIAAMGACLFMAGLNYHPEQRGRHQYASQDEYRVPSVSRAIPTPARTPHPERAEWRQESDLQAQWKAADWTLWGTVVSGFSAITALIGLLLVRETLRHTADATKAAAEAAKASLRSADIAEREHREGSRGHLFAMISQSTIGFTGTDGTIPQVEFALKNVGQRHVIVRVARYGLIRQSRGEKLAEYPARMTNSASALQPKLIEPGQEESFDGTMFGSGNWLTEDNWPDFEDTVYFQILVFYTDHLEMLREYSVTWRAYSPVPDEWDGMFLYERGYDRQVGEVGKSR